MVEINNLEIENNNNNSIEQQSEHHNYKLSLFRSYSSPSCLSLPPANFSKVSEGIYRSSCPNLQNLEFLKNLNLKSIVYFIPGDYPQENKQFIATHNINLFHFPTKK